MFSQGSCHNLLKKKLYLFSENLHQVPNFHCYRYFVQHIELDTHTEVVFLIDAAENQNPSAEILERTTHTVNYNFRSSLS